MFEEIVGSSKAIRSVLTQVAKVAPSDSTVLVLGETGTGKELIARAIHRRSNRSSRAFIRVNCAAIPPRSLPPSCSDTREARSPVRSNGASDDSSWPTRHDLPRRNRGPASPKPRSRSYECFKSGKSNGSAAASQSLWTCEYWPPRTATLKQPSAAGTFREDLFYRLNVFPIQIPSLRERIDDIPLLVTYLVERYAKKASKRISAIQDETSRLFQAYEWPGNIRELQNVIERAVVLCESETFSVDQTWLKPEEQRLSPTSLDLSTALAKHEKELIESALADCGGQTGGPAGAAVKLGLPRQTLDSRIKALGINRHRFKIHQAERSSTRG